MPLINVKFIDVAFTPKLKKEIDGANLPVCREARPGIAYRAGNDCRERLSSNKLHSKHSHARIETYQRKLQRLASAQLHGRDDLLV